MEDEIAFCQKCGTKAITELYPKEETVDTYYQSNSLIFKYNGISVDLNEFKIKHGNNRIAAIKEIRNLTNLDLATSKKVVDEAYDGRLYVPTQSKNNKGCLIVLAWIFLFPIMLIIVIAKSHKLTRTLKTIFIALIVMVCAIIAISSSAQSNNEAKVLFAQIETVMNNNDYLEAEAKLNKLIKDYPYSDNIDDAKSMLESIKPKVEKIKVEEEAAAKKEAALEEAAEKAKEEKEAKQKNIQIIIDATALQQDESEKVFDDLLSVGFKSITECTLGFGTGVDDLQSFRAVCDGIITILTIEKRKTYYIGIGSVDLFSSEQGGVLNQAIDFILTSDEEYSFISNSESYVKEGLKSPSTAKFPGQIFESDKWSVGRYKDIVQVRAYVDSQNSFGAVIRSDFVVEMDYTTSMCTYLAIDGENMYGTAFVIPK